jgi:hypothetical protein
LIGVKTNHSGFHSWNTSYGLTLMFTFTVSKKAAFLHDKKFSKTQNIIFSIIKKVQGFG